MHIYSWKEGGFGPRPKFDLIEDDLLKIKPGLSAFKDRPHEAGASLAPLIEHARQTVPQVLRPKTPVFLMATGGLRMVGDEAQTQILQSVCDTLDDTLFRFQCEWATVIDGADEAVYGWLSINYLLDQLYAVREPDANGEKGKVIRAPTPAGTLDLGGASVQIVFPTPEKIWPRGYHKQLVIDDHKQHLYVKSHLGYGLDEARSKALDELIAHHTVGMLGLHPERQSQENSFFPSCNSLLPSRVPPCPSIAAHV
jgi:Golgi nucleoside diphosphatase